MFPYSSDYIFTLLKCWVLVLVLLFVITQPLVVEPSNYFYWLSLARLLIAQSFNFLHLGIKSSKGFPAILPILRHQLFTIFPYISSWFVRNCKYFYAILASIIPKLFGITKFFFLGLELLFTNIKNSSSSILTFTPVGTNVGLFPNL